MMSIFEIQEVGLEVSGWQGAQLQEVLVDGRKRPGGGSDPRSLRLGFFHESRVKWLLFDYDQATPCLVIFSAQKPPEPQKIRRPMELFLRSAFVGRRLTGVTLEKKPTEPQLTLEFGEGYLLRFLIVPNFRNLWAVAGDKQISEFKPEPVPNSLRLDEGSRSLDEMRRIWLAHRIGGGGGAVDASAVSPKTRKGDPLEQKRSTLRRREIALAKVRAELDSKRHHPARSIGEWIKTHQTLIIPKDREDSWLTYIDQKKPLSANIENLFRIAKSQEAKVGGTYKRLLELEAEVLKLKEEIERGIVEPSDPPTSNKSIDLFEAAQAKGRKIQVAENLTIYIGKNAKENLAILRKAQPFDYWLHVKDQPGAHGIIRRTRTRVVSDAELVKAATALLENSLKRRAIELKGEVFDVLIVECRFVRPIKGDRLGRVHYSNDRVIRVRL